MSKANIQKRRRQRIQQLMKQSHKKAKREHSSVFDPSDLHEAKQRYRSDDPEYVWKHQPPPWAAYERISDENDGSSVQKSKSLVIKFVLSVILLCGGIVLFEIDKPWAYKGQQWVQQTLTKQGNFETIAAWYQHTFDGSPAFIPPLEQLWNQDSKKVVVATRRTYHTPAVGKIIVPFEVNREGVQVLPDHNDFIISIDEGRVVYTGENERNGLTVIIQHPQQVWSIYGQLAETSLQQNDWVEGGDVVGKVKQQNGELLPFYFAVRVNGTNKNPADVISFHE